MNGGVASGSFGQSKVSRLAAAAVNVSSGCSRRALVLLAQLLLQRTVILLELRPLRVAAQARHHVDRPARHRARVPCVPLNSGAIFTAVC